MGSSWLDKSANAYKISLAHLIPWEEVFLPRTQTAMKLRDGLAYRLQWSAPRFSEREVATIVCINAPGLVTLQAQLLRQVLELMEGIWETERAHT
jgi:hypothetical protein